jgi:DNA invertase Pin-like site-specific DNA recombinase
MAKRQDLDPWQSRRAATYARVSTSKQDEEGTSLTTQDQRNRAFAAEQGWSLDEAHVYRRSTAARSCGTGRS